MREFFTPEERDVVLSQIDDLAVASLLKTVTEEVDKVYSMSGNENSTTVAIIREAVKRIERPRYA